MENHDLSSQTDKRMGRYILIILIITVIIAGVSIWFVQKNRHQNNPNSTDRLPIIATPIPSPLPTSTGALQNEFYSPLTNTTKQIKAYEIVIENGTISTDMIVKDREHDVYFINKDTSAPYSLEIYKDNALIESPVLSPRQVYSTPLADIGSYSFKILENGMVKFEGKIYVQEKH